MEKKSFSSHQEMYNDYKKDEKTKKNRKIRKNVVFYGGISIILFILLLYFISPISHIGTIFIRGNQILTKQEILEIGNLKQNDFLIFVLTGNIENNLEKNPFILEATVKKVSNRGIEIDIVENRIFAYQFGEYPKIFFFDGKEMDLTEKQLHLLMTVPYINGFLEKEFRENMRIAFLEVDENIFRLISEIHEYSTSYDAHMIRLVMQDGNQIFTSLLSLKSLNYYLEILNNLKVSNSCIYIDELSGSAYSMVCPTEENNGEEIIGEIIEEWTMKILWNEENS